ncbi:MAG TPA: histidine phosphatase family protein [Stellaceae bacterium]|jgi:broad specificity phosphatase PhoE|nr:histidine phosphatase family protein [Stellaceae bacterium]
MVRIILARHGHVDWLAPERFRGRAELPLSDLGRRQAQAVARYIAATWKPDAVYTSPLGRCRETGAEIAAPFRLELRPVDGLADIDYGEWQGLTRDEAQERWPDETELWFRTPHIAAIPGGETLAALLSRTSAALRDILWRHPDQTVVLVGHDSVNRVLLLFALEAPLSRYWHLRQEPCAVNELFFDNDSFIIGSINQTQHLSGL